MGEVARGGRTVLFVSHNFGAVRQLCARSLLLNNGRISLDGQTNEVIEVYSNSKEMPDSISFRSSKANPTITHVAVDRKALVENTIIVDIHFESPWPLRPICGLVVYAASGEPVWGSNGRFHARIDAEAPVTVGHVRCEGRDLPLVPAPYSISVWLGDWQRDYDMKDNALRFFLGRDHDSQFRPPSLVNGNVDWPARWSYIGKTPNSTSILQNRIQS
jgi:lipopolysaccharide transport system ATP-binding protein